MANFRKWNSEFMYAPILPQDNFLNEDGGTIQNLRFRDLLPYGLVTEDLPLILPQREDEGSSSISGGRNEDVVLPSQFTPGAGSIPERALPFLMVMRIGGKITVTHQVAQEWTIEAVQASEISTGSYFCFDVIDSDGVHTKYQAWFDKNGDGSEDEPDAEDCFDPIDDNSDWVLQSTTAGKRELVQIDISTDTSAQDVSDSIVSAIDALADVSASNSSSTTTTVTNDNDGAVMDAFDVNSGLTVSNTTRGRDKREIEFDATTLEKHEYFGFLFQSENGSNDRKYDIVGCSVAEHTLSVEMGEGEGGVMSEEVAYMNAGIEEEYGSITMIERPRSPHGTEWTKDISPFGNTYKVRDWGTCAGNCKLELGSNELDATWRGFTIFIENDLAHRYDGGGQFASGVTYNLRNCEITANIQADAYEIFELQRQHILDYSDDLSITLKSADKQDSDLYLEFTCDKCRLEPFEETIVADGNPENYELSLRPAPGATFKYTLQTVIPSYYYGGDIEDE